MIVIVPHNIDYGTISSSIPEDEAAWSADKTYAKGDKARVGYDIYTSMEASNKGNKPAETSSGVSLKWKKSGTSNRGAIFDAFVHTQSVAPEGTALEITVPWLMASGFAVFNVSGATAMTVSIANADGETVASKQYNLLDGVDNWYDYFTGHFSYIRDIVDMDLGGFLSGTVTVALTGSQPAAGRLIIGDAVDVGATLDGVVAELVHYSVVETDPDFGVTEIVERASTKKYECTLSFPKGRADTVFEFFEKIRATPCVFQGDNVPVDAGGQQFLTVYGLWRRASLKDKGSSLCTYNLEIMGLI